MPPKKEKTSASLATKAAATPTPKTSSNENLPTRSPVSAAAASTRPLTRSAAKAQATAQGTAPVLLPPMESNRTTPKPPPQPPKPLPKYLAPPTHATADLPTEVWVLIFESVLRTVGLGPLLICGSVCQSWREIIHAAPSPLDKHLRPLCPRFGVTPPPAAASPGTGGKSVASTLARRCNRACHACLKTLYSRDKRAKTLWPLTNQILCFECRVDAIKAAGIRGRTISRPRGNKLIEYSVVRLGVPGDYVREKMTPEVIQERWGPTKVYRKGEVGQVLLALMGPKERKKKQR